MAFHFFITSLPGLARNRKGDRLLPAIGQTDAHTARMKLKQIKLLLAFIIRLFEDVDGRCYKDDHKYAFYRVCLKIQIK